MDVKCYLEENLSQRCEQGAICWRRPVSFVALKLLFFLVVGTIASLRQILCLLFGLVLTSPGFAAVTCGSLFPARKAAWGYHASPELTLTLLDPAYSRNTSRYGPGVYFYADPTAVANHAKSINEGRIKYDKNTRPARVYTAKLRLARVLDMTKVYKLSELKFIFSRLNNERAFSKMDPSAKLTGQEFYDRLTNHFASNSKILLDRGVVGAVTAKSKVNELLLSAGIEILIGQIPVPGSSLTEKAYISLLPVSVD